MPDNSRVAPELRFSIQQSLAAFASLPFETAALAFWKTLHYSSELRYADLPSDAAGFADAFGIGSTLRADKALVPLWDKIHFLFQVTDDEIQSQNKLFGGEVNKERHDSYLFFALELLPRENGGAHPCGTLAQIAREINRPFGSPVLVLFKDGSTLSLAVVDRRDNKQDASREVLERVTLIANINFQNPHPAHLRILSELELSGLKVSNWTELHKKWKEVLDLSELNKKFFRELSDWYFWARDNPLAKYPGTAGGIGGENERAVWLIRLLTRAMFVYFIKERGLVPEAFFAPAQFSPLLKDSSPQSGSYYNGILQNLFFASLNAEAANRGWFDSEKSYQGKDEKYLIHTKRRGAELFQNPDAVEKLFDQVPFLNGGLFECLDSRDEDNKETRLDGFSSQPKKRATLPNFLL